MRIGSLDTRATAPASSCEESALLLPLPQWRGAGSGTALQSSGRRHASTPDLAVHRVTGWFLCPAFVLYSLRLFGSEAVLGAVVYATALFVRIPPLYLGGVGTWGDYHDAFPARVWS